MTPKTKTAADIASAVEQASELACHALREFKEHDDLEAHCRIVRALTKLTKGVLEHTTWRELRNDCYVYDEQLHAALERRIALDAEVLAEMAARARSAR